MRFHLCQVELNYERIEHCEKYSEEIPGFEFRNKVKGGLTGYAQIYGKYNQPRWTSYGLI